MQIGFPGLLCLIFVVAKLAGWITWSWLWVLSPIWISFLLVLLILAGMFTIALVAR